MSIQSRAEIIAPSKNTTNQNSHNPQSKTHPLPEEMSTHEIARATGIPQSTVRDTLRRAMLKLAKNKMLHDLYEASLYKEREQAIRQSGGSTISRIKRSLRS